MGLQKTAEVFVKRTCVPVAWRVVLLAGLAALMLELPESSLGQARGRGGRRAQAQGRAGAAGEITDAQVVAAMQKGADFLLSHMNGDNWEIPGYKWPGTGEAGGVTGVAVYALLHAGESLQDDPDYHSKLNWRSKEMQPPIQWLSKNMPEDTYAAALEASALTLVPRRKDEKPDEGTHPALEACKWYLLTGMGADGGYSYTSVGLEKFDGAWKNYFQDAVKGTRTGQSKTSLDNVVKGLYANFGGPDPVFQKKVAELQEKLRKAKDDRERALINAEMKELDNYAHQIPAPNDAKAQLAAAKKKLGDLLSKNGNPAGLTTTDAKSKKPRPMTRDDLENDVKYARSQVEKLEADLTGKVQPRGDLSNGQYGILGAWALADVGIEFPDHYWEVQDRFWRFMQNPDGGWPYNNAQRRDTTDTMGLAGIASLFIAQEFVDTDLRLVPKPDKNLDSGLAWLTKNFAPSNNLYYMYGVERVGLSSGLKFFGTTDWYKTGAAVVVKRQNADGSWEGGFYGGNQAAVGTSYAMLFLARGRNPVVFNKLQYNGYWNARPRDDAYITRWMSKRFEKPINWQSVNLQVNPDEWMDAPVLLITGSQDPKFSADDLAKLRQFIDAGGMIFSSADGNSLAFSNAIKKYAAQVVNDKYEMRQLPKNHELFSKELGVELPNPPPVLGMSNGVREIWIHSSQDLGADWQMRRFAKKPSFEIAAAVYLYASGMGSLRSKLQPLAVAATTAAPARTIDVARIDYSGNADPEPGAWPRMAKLARADFKTQVNLSKVKFAGLDAKKYPLADLTGTAKVTWTSEEMASLRSYLDNGGTILMDPAGGNADFAAACRDLAKQVYPNELLSELPPDHPIITGAMPDGIKITDAELRKYGALLLKHRITAPVLEQIAIGGRTKILFSQWDISSGFLGTNTWGILGYAPGTAQEIGRNILLYANHPSGPAAPSATAAPAANVH